MSQLTDRFLGWTDYVVGWAHYLSIVSMPWGGSAGEISCVSAFYLALLVRFVVATVFSALRVLLGLPVSELSQLSVYLSVHVGYSL